MPRSFPRGRLPAALLTVVVALGALAAPAQAAVSTDAAAQKLRIDKTVGVFGDGAAAVVELTITCRAGAIESYLNTRISQADGPYGTVYGESSAYVSCTGEPQSIPVALAGFGPFGAGPAFVSAELQVCDDFGCRTTEKARGVKLATGGDERPTFESDHLTYELPETGEIKGAGAGAVVLVPYTCAAGMDGTFEGFLAQTTGDGFVNASSDYADMRCTATSRTGVLAFHAGGTAWSPGDAFLMVTGFSCPPGPVGCETASTFRTVTLD